VIIEPRRREDREEDRPGLGSALLASSRFKLFGRSAATGGVDMARRRVTLGIGIGVGVESIPGTRAGDSA
jgi:hypothetical protein